MAEVSYVTQPTKLIVPVDKLSTEIFRLDEDKLNAMIKDKNLEHSFTESEPRYEDKSSKRKNVATTTFKFWYQGKEVEVFTLNFFDQIVLSACMTEFFRGTNIITPNIIFRDLGGAKNSCCSSYIDLIDQSIQKMSDLKIMLNASEASKYLFQIKSTAFKKTRQEFMLTTDEVDVKINGKPCTGYQIKQNSIILEYAQSKGQIIQIPVEHLAVPHTKNTLVFMLLKFYIYYRILRINRKLFNAKVSKKERSKPQSIVLNTLYKVCGFAEQVNDWQFRARLQRYINQYLDHLKSCNVISSYQLLDSNNNPQKYLKDCNKISFIPVKPIISEEKEQDDEE